ncbi:MAG: hypothetical protein ABII25_06070 [bacterium]
MKKQFVNIIIFLCFFSICCITNSDENNNSKTINKLVWETIGGGDRKFEIYESNNNYEVTVHRYNFQERKDIFSLTNEDEEVFSLVNAIFLGNKDLHDETFTPSGEIGTWTTIILIYSDSTEEKISNIKAWGDLSIISSFVENKLNGTN